MNYNKVFCGIFLVAFPFISGMSQHIFDWSTAELQGYNLVPTAMILSGLYLIYKGTRKQITGGVSADNK